MADFRLTTVLWTLVLLHVYVCQSCSPPEGWRPPTVVDKILQVPNVIYGRVRATYPDEHYNTAYTVELEVYCILKGATTPLVINITQGGYIPGHCESSTFVVNEAYIARARNGGGQLTMSGSNIDATEENLKEITKACGLNPVTRPAGSTSKLECPVSAPVCQSEPTPYDRPTPMPPKWFKDHGDDGSKMEMKPGDISSASAAVFTVATTTLAATAALVLSKIIK